jgi:hypothetical protein
VPDITATPHHVVGEVAFAALDGGRESRFVVRGQFWFAHQ